VPKDSLLRSRRVDWLDPKCFPACLVATEVWTDSDTQTFLQEMTYPYINRGNVHWLPEVDTYLSSDFSY
jgi:hypothetical protein